MAPILVTLDTSHFERSALKVIAEKNIESMFSYATAFNADLSKWDVSSVTDMRGMFGGASSFTGTLCGAWFASTADKDGMFDGSSGKICRKRVAE